MVEGAKDDDFLCLLLCRSLPPFYCPSFDKKAMMYFLVGFLVGAAIFYWAGFWLGGGFER
jgi:hypothetical protein